MNRKFSARASVLLITVLMLVTLTGCGSSEAAAKTLTPKSIVEGDRTIWYMIDCGSVENYGEEAIPLYIYIVENGHVKEYWNHALELTMKDLAKMSDDEITARLEQLAKEYNEKKPDNSDIVEWDVSKIRIDVLNSDVEPTDYYSRESVSDDHIQMIIFGELLDQPVTIAGIQYGGYYQTHDHEDYVVTKTDDNTTFGFETLDDCDETYPSTDETQGYIYLNK